MIRCFLDLQTDIIFGGNDRAKINKFLDYIESITMGRNLTFNKSNRTPQLVDNIYIVLQSLTAKSILVETFLSYFVLLGMSDVGLETWPHV